MKEVGRVTAEGKESYTRRNIEEKIMYVCDIDPLCAKIKCASSGMKGGLLFSSFVNVIQNSVRDKNSLKVQINHRDMHRVS
jgi:hypothetical protein